MFIIMMMVMIRVMNSNEDDYDNVQGVIIAIDNDKHDEDKCENIFIHRIMRCNIITVT